MSLAGQGPRFAVALAVLLAAGALGLRRAGHMGALRTAPPLVVSEAPVSTLYDTVRSGETLSQLFGRRGISDVDWAALRAAVRNFNPSRVRSGLEFTFRQRHGESAPYEFAVRVSNDERLWVRRASHSGEWTPEVEHITWRVETFLASGEVETSVSDAITSSLSDTLLSLEDRITLVYELAEVYDWVVDFSRDVMRGDRFRLLAERLVSSEGERRLGRILAARLDIGPRPLYAFRFDDPSGREEFWDENARSMRRELLRAPLEYRRISSGFSRRRFHPILRRSRPHNGIDFGAAYGAPVRSVGNGVVTVAGRSGGYGNLVEIRHANGQVTRYAHLSDFATGIHEGASVEQGQTIGYVGATGLATSPHLHYELRVNGRAVDPRRRFNTAPGAPLPAHRRAGFEAERLRFIGLLEPGSTPPVTRVD
ncbi:MAG TPA: M23 family metallopeptidase [Gemmatimonadales bacterium]|nr:M23 family metallopeptidase [Gemmatimonadales bacterium]